MDATEQRESGDEARRRRKGRFWPLFIVGLLLVHVGGVMFLIYLATGDPSFQVEPDYYQKGLAWDERMEQDRANLRLGWRSEVSLQRTAPQRAYLQARISDREGLPVAGAKVELVTFHKARAGEIIRSTMRELAPGTYATQLPLKRTGLWEIRLEARRGGELFTQRIDRRLRAGGEGTGAVTGKLTQP